jgi:hypothetical protein
MKLSLAKKIAASSMHDAIALRVLINELDGITLDDAAMRIQSRTGIAMPTTYAGRRRALRSIGCVVTDARVFKA